MERRDTIPASNSRATEPHALLAGGGTGGHVFPGLAVARELERRGWRVSWAGSPRSIESRLVSEHRIDFHGLPALPVVGTGMAGKARALSTLARSAWGARALVRRLGTRVVVGTGGYVSAPAVVGARWARRPALLIEPNAEAGLANRWLSRLASEAAVAYETTRAQLACPSHTTGVPIRAEFFEQGEPPAPPPWRLLVLGGSQGARQINDLVPAALATLPAALESVVVCHQTGEAHLETTREAYLAAGHTSASVEADRDAGAVRAHEAGGPQARPEGSLSVRFEIVPFISDMAGAMGGCHLIVSRAGAITLAEVCAAGRASVLVPLALAAGHQASNARRLAEAGAAAFLPPTATAGDLARLLDELLADARKLRKMGDAARLLAKRDATAAIADRVCDLGATGETS